MLVEINPMVRSDQSNFRVHILTPYLVGRYTGRGRGVRAGWDHTRCTRGQRRWCVGTTTSPMKSGGADARLWPLSLRRWLCCILTGSASSGSSMPQLHEKEDKYEEKRHKYMRKSTQGQSHDKQRQYWDRKPHIALLRWKRFYRRPFTLGILM